MKWTFHPQCGVRRFLAKQEVTLSLLTVFVSSTQRAPPCGISHTVDIVLSKREHVVSLGVVHLRLEEWTKQ